MMVAVGLIVTLAVGLFRGSWTDSVPVTVISDRAGLVMNPDAKVKMRGVEVGKVAYIEQRPDGQAAIHLAIQRGQLRYIPSNVAVDVTSSTVFGAKFVKLLPPGNPERERLQEGQILQGEHVTVELNTVFQQLTQLLDKIDPAKLNETLGALSKAFDGRGERLGQMLTDLDAFLTKLEPSLPNLRTDIAALPEVLRAYADAAPDLVRIADNTTSISQSIVDEQQNLDAVLVSVIGLANTGNDVIGGNRQAITDLLHLLVPTTDLLNEYHEALNCGIAGLIPFTHAPPQPENAVVISTGFTLGIERYRYPSDLPKVNATGGPTCRELGLPTLAPQTQPPFVVADIGANPWQYGNQGLMRNTDALKQALFGPIDGPPRNATQVGQPG
jgi:phospholipid/cholesterol/gamma-HCH transport system substrate-binding protein